MVFDNDALEAQRPEPGDLYWHHKGGLYRVTGLCTVEATQAPGVLYQALDPLARQDHWMRPLFDFLGPAGETGNARFTPLRRPGLAPLRGYIPRDVLGDADLEAVLSRYDEPWRYAHGRRHVLDMFAWAAAYRMPLTLEQSMAVLFHDLVYVPGAPAGHNEALSAWLMQVFRPCVCQEVDWLLVGRIIEDTSSHQPSTAQSPAVLDLDLSSLGDDPVHFVAANELVWLENRHLLQGPSARKEYDTRRLRFLQDLATRELLFRDALRDREDAAWANLDRLKMAWVRQYGED
jgi:predicted metal-dependent HD superfamily phosphohydrolase